MAYTIIGWFDCIGGSHRDWRRSVLFDATTNEEREMIWQLGWTTLPGLRGLSVSEFRAAPTATSDNVGGVTLEFADEVERDAFLRRIEAEFASRRFTNAADAFDTVKAFVLQHAAKH